jgi:hypothetical protein
LKIIGLIFSHSLGPLPIVAQDCFEFVHSCK